MSTGLSFRWLGVAGVELACGGRTLLIDPFFTRPPFHRLFLGCVAPDRACISRHIHRADAALVTHAHYDHLMDVPDTAELTGARVYGSPNVCALVRLSGQPDDRIQSIAPGDVLECGPFRVTVLESRHMPTPLDRWINGTLRTGLQPPLRLTDYRMDACFSFLIEANGLRLLHGETPVPAEVWFSAPVRGFDVRPALEDIRPRMVVPIHWDDMFRPLSRPIRPSLTLPRRGLRLTGRLDLGAYAQAIEQFAAGTCVLVPEIFRTYRLDANCRPGGQTAR